MGYICVKGTYEIPVYSGIDVVSNCLDDIDPEDIPIYPIRLFGYIVPYGIKQMFNIDQEWSFMDYGFH